MLAKKTLLFLSILFISHLTLAQEWLVLYNQSNDDYNNYDLTSAKASATKALELFLVEVPNEHKNTAAILRHLALISYELGEYPAGIEYALREKDMLQSLNLSDEENFAVTLYNLGLMYSANSQLSEALTSLNQAKELMLVYHTSSELEVAEIEGNIAIVQYYRNDLEACKSLFESSLNTMAVLEEQSPEYPNILYVYGEYCLDTNQPRKAIDALLPIKEAYAEQGASESLGSILVKVASAYELTGELDQAIDHYRSAIQTFDQVNAQSSPDYLIALNNLSLLYQRKGTLDLAKALLQQVISHRQANKDLAYYMALSNMGNIHYMNKGYDSALLIYDEIILEFAAVDNDSKPYYAAVTGKSLVLITQGKHIEALETVDMGIEKSGDNTDFIVPLLKSKASSLTALGKYKEAASVLDEALSLSGDSPLARIAIQARQAQLYILTNELSAAADIYIEIKPFYESQQSSAPLQYATFLGNYAIYLQASGNFVDAEQALLESIEIKASILDDDNANYLSSLENLGILYMTTGKYSKSYEVLTQVERKKRESPLVSDASRAYTFTNLGVITRAMGAYSDSEDFFRSALRRYKNSLGEDHPYYANTANELGVLYMKMGNTKAAKPLFESALNTYEKHYGKYHLDYASALENLASLNYMEDNISESMEQLEEALEIDKIVLGTDHPLYSKTLHNLASVLEELEEYDRATALYEESLAINEKLFGKEHPSYANTLYNLAVLKQELEYYDEAQEYYQQVVDIRSKLLNENHPDLAYSYFGLASVKQKTEDYEGARADYHLVLDKYLESINNYFPSLSEGEKSAFYAKIKPVFEAYQDFAVEYVYLKHGNDSIRQAIIGNLYNLQLSTKALLLNASNKIRNTILNSGDETLVNKFNEWQSIKEDLVKALNMSNEELVKNKIDPEALQTKSNVLEKEISRMSSAFAGEFDKQVVTWESIHDYLAEDEVAIEILRIKKNLKNDSIYYAALINRGGSQSHPELVVIQDGINMELKLFKQYKNMIVFKIDNPRSFGVYWQQIDDQMVGVKRVFLSSDGVYNKININTLYDPENKEFVFDKYAIYLLSNTRELVESDEEDVHEDTNTNTAAIFGFPDYALGGELIASTGSTERGFEAGISELPGTLKEIESIVASLEKNYWTFDEYQRAEANEVNVKKINSPKLLHIATHGFFMPDIAIQENSNEGIQTREARYNPLFRSGLLLAGAAKSLKGEALPYDEDGILTAYEAMNLNLDHTELVVMSACETGLGEVKNGEGVYGLQRSFMVAGADNLIMSLWKVNDATTQKLMSEFYSNWIGGEPKQAAFRRAIQSLKKEYKQPYYWGAFVMLGK